MGGGDVKPEYESAPEGAATVVAATASSDSDPVVLEVRPEFTLINPCPPRPGEARQSRDEVMVMARILAVREADDDRRAPVSICAVIDRSESMKANIELVKQSLVFMVQQLREEDQLSILVFDHEVSTVLPMTNMDLEGKQKAIVAVGKLRERGQTNLSGGLLAGLQQFLMTKPREGEKAKIESILLFTDGKANRGIKDQKTITRATRSVIAQIGRQVSVFTFGFGEEHEADVLQAIADAGNGLYYFVSDVESIPDSFCDCLGGLLSVVAQNISLEVEACHEHRLEKPLTGFEVSSPTPNSHRVQIPDIYSEESKDILVNVLLSVKGQFDLDDPKPIPTEIAKFRLVYFDVQSCQLRTIEQTALVEILPPAITAADLGLERAQKLTEADNEVALQRIRLETTHALQEADRQASANNARAARDELARCMQRIDASPISSEPFVQHQRLTLATASEGISDQRSYKSYGAKHVRGLAHANAQQRSNTNPLFDATVVPQSALSHSSSGAHGEVRPPCTSPRRSEAASISSAACGGIPKAPPLPGMHSSAAAAKTYQVQYNPYRGKKKAKLMQDFWDKKGQGPAKEEEEEE